MIDAPVPLMQREREFAQLLELYREEQPTSVLEIGVAHGGSLFHWLNDARDDVPVTIVAVDDFATFEDNRALFPLWAPPNVTLHVIEGRSYGAQTTERVREIEQHFDWVFVDADHSYETVLADWLIYGRHARTCALHDIVSDARVHPEIEVDTLWAELRRKYETREIVDDAHAAWGGIGVVWPSRPRRESRRKPPSTYAARDTCA